MSPNAGRDRKIREVYASGAMTLQQIGKELGITKQRVAQIVSGDKPKRDYRKKPVSLLVGDRVRIRARSQFNGATGTVTERLETGIRVMIDEEFSGWAKGIPLGFYKHEVERE